MAYLPILIYHKFMPNVGKYTFRPMKPVMENRPRAPKRKFHLLTINLRGRTVKFSPWKSKDYFLNGFSVKTIVLVGIYNQQFKGTILFMVFDFQGSAKFFGGCNHQKTIDTPNSDGFNHQGLPTINIH